LQVAKAAGSPQLALDILERAPQLELSVSKRLCTQAAAVCIAAQDYPALEMAYSLQLLHCGEPNGKAVFQLMKHYSEAGGMEAQMAALAQEAAAHGIVLSPPAQQMLQRAQAKLQGAAA
jgi:hypothetical protein